MSGLDEGSVPHTLRGRSRSAPPSPAQPYFFGSGVLVEQDGLRTVEYCVLDAFATIALKFRAAWVMNWTGGRARWQPTPQALPGLLMLRTALAGEAVVIATRSAEDHRLPACAVEDADLVVSADALYGDAELQAHAPAATSRMACAHREALVTEHTAFLVAARLHEIWTIAEAARRAPPESRTSAAVLRFPDGAAATDSDISKPSGLWRAGLSAWLGGARL